MKHKSIALVFSGDFPEGNTKNARLKVLGETLTKEGWEVKYISVYPSKYSISPGFKQTKKWGDYKIIRLSLGRTYWRTLPARAIQIATGIANLMMYSIFFTRQYDILYFYNPRFTDSMLGLLLCKAVGKKVVVDQTELFSSYAGKKRHFLEEKIIAKRANMVFAISVKIKDYFKNLDTSGKLYLLPIMVDMGRFKELRKEIDHLVGYIGSFAAKDGVPDLVQGFAIARKTLPDLKLRLIGFNPDPELLDNQLHELELLDHVEITGNVSFDEVPWLLKECDTLVMNRRHTSFASFGYPIKLGEYFACGKVVIMSNIDGFSTDFQNGNQAYLYEPNDPNAIANILKYRYANSGESEAIAKRGYQYAKENLAAERNAMFFVNAIDELVK